MIVPEFPSSATIVRGKSGDERLFIDAYMKHNMTKFWKTKMVDKFIAELSRGLKIRYNTELIMECETQKQLRVSKWNN